MEQEIFIPKNNKNKDVKNRFTYIITYKKSKEETIKNIANIFIKHYTD